jgi:hypothetical protein
MNPGSPIFAQLMNDLPLKAFHKCVDRYKGDCVFWPIVTAHSGRA